MSVPWVSIGSVLNLAEAEVPVEAESTYPMVGVLGHGRGLFLRESIQGVDTSYKTLRQMRVGQIVYSRLKAFEGAFAVVGEEQDGRFASGEFPSFDPDQSRIDVRWLGHLLHTSWFKKRVAELSQGIGARRERLSVSKFLSISIPLPDIDTQREVAARLDRFGRPNVDSQFPIRLTKLRDEIVLRAGENAQAVPFGELFQLQRRRVVPIFDELYREVGVRSFGKGLFVKDPVSGGQIGAKRVFRVEPDDLIISNIFAWEGAVARASKEHNGLIGSHRFMTWTPSSDRMTSAYAATFLTSRSGVALLREASPGSAGRNRTLAIKNLELINIPVPDLSVQKQLEKHVEVIARVERLAQQRHELASTLLPAARNEEFRKLLGR